jgi:hypothetical protein
MWTSSELPSLYVDRPRLSYFSVYLQPAIRMNTRSATTASVEVPLSHYCMSYHTVSHLRRCLYLIFPLLASRSADELNTRSPSSICLDHAYDSLQAFQHLKRLCFAFHPQQILHELAAASCSACCCLVLCCRPDAGEPDVPVCLHGE